MTDDDLLENMLDRWEEADLRRQPLSAAELCGSRTDLIPRLKQEIEKLISLKKLEPTDLRGGRPAVGDDDPQPQLQHQRYQLLPEKLGRGSEGDVWKGHDKLLNRDVAIKLPRLHAEQLLEEARLVARLNHPHILKVFDCGHDDRGTAFVVIELMQGRSLHDRLQAGGGQVRPAVAVRWARQLADALAALHQYGRVHRDVKPGNILIDSHDNAILADFGIAVEVTAAPTGSSTGTPGYKSPEQRRAAALDARSDVFSLAVVLHEMLTGSPPFANLDEIATRDRHAPPPTVKLSSRVPARLRPLLQRSLATDPVARPRSATEFAAALDRAWRRSRLGIWLGRAAVAAAVGLAVLGWRLRQVHVAGEAAIRAQTEKARATMLEATGVFEESRRKIDDVRALSRRIVDEAMNDPFHRARRAENEARRRAEAAIDRE